MPVWSIPAPSSAPSAVGVWPERCSTSIRPTTSRNWIPAVLPTHASALANPVIFDISGRFGILLEFYGCTITAGYPSNLDSVTFLRIVNGLIPPDSGTILIDGRAVKDVIASGFVEQLYR